MKKLWIKPEKLSETKIRFSSSISFLLKFYGSLSEHFLPSALLMEIWTSDKSS